MTAPTTLKPSAEMRAAAAIVGCDHRHPINPPDGSLAKPGDCRECGAAYGREPVPEWLREPLEAWLLEAAYRFDRDFWPDHAALHMARAINGGAS